MNDFHPVKFKNKNDIGYHRTLVFTMKGRISSDFHFSDSGGDWFANDKRLTVYPVRSRMIGMDMTDSNPIRFDP